jgi:RNA-directed DNA polymerase
LGIPVMRTRAEQALAKLVLEPAWEARFEANSDGFRPGRSAHDAVEAIFNGIRFKPKYVLDADIAKCFDRIDHRALLDKLRTTTRLRRAIRGWLKAGSWTTGRCSRPKGTPGRVASPPREHRAARIGDGYQGCLPVTAMVNGRRVCPWQPIVIRYADDFLVLHEDRTVIERCRQIATAWLADMGLELKPSKTRITHTLRETGATWALISWDSRSANIPLARPTREEHHRGTARLQDHHHAQQRSRPAAHARNEQRDPAHKGANQAALIGHLNPVIRGW